MSPQWHRYPKVFKKCAKRTFFRVKKNPPALRWVIFFAVLENRQKQRFPNDRAIKSCSKSAQKGHFLVVGTHHHSSAFAFFFEKQKKIPRADKRFWKKWNFISHSINVVFFFSKKKISRADKRFWKKVSFSTLNFLHN